MKFQAGTSTNPVFAQRVLWAGVAVLVLLAGEAALQATWYWLAIVVLVAAAALILAGVQQGPGARALQAGIGVLALTSTIATVRMGHLVYHATLLQHEAVAGATHQRDALLRSAVAASRRLTETALERAASRVPGVTPRLDDLLGATGVETAIAVIAGDSVIAVAGPHRMQPIMRPMPAALVATPFARMLVIRATHDDRQAQAVLLLDSLPGLPVAAPSLAARVGSSGVTWHWLGRADGAVEYASDAAAVSGVIAAMQPVPPPVSSFVRREARVARQLVGAGLLVLALVILITVSHPATRAGAILLTLWALARSDVGNTPFGLDVIRALLVAAVLLMLAVALWRRSTRRSWPVRSAALLLLIATPVLVQLVASRLMPSTDPFTLLGGFVWQAVLALGAAGLLAVANALLRDAGDATASPVWGTCVTLATLLIGLIGIVAWAPGGWPGWYLPLWLVPLLLMMPVTHPRLRLVALATTAGALAALATWSASLRIRMTLAEGDLARLDAPVDTAAVRGLDQLALDALRLHATRLDRLYAAWEASPLAAEGVPTYLALWSADGRQRQVVALDSLSVGWSELATLVSHAGSQAERIGLPRGVGHHEVLILPIAPDTIATVTVGPRSRLLSPTTFGLLVGWRSPSSSPPYSVDVATDAAQPADGIFRRSHRYVTADRIVTAGDVPRDVRVTVEMSSPQPFLVRASLAVLLDVLLVLAMWWLLDRATGPPHAGPTVVFRRSYRRTVATALMAFFMVPAALFTASAIARLRQESQQSHAAELAGAIRDVAVAGGLGIAEQAQPNTDSLASVADYANAELGVYRRGRLIAASDPLLAELGLLPPVIDRTSRDVTSLDPDAMPPPFAGAPLRLGAIDTGPVGTLLVAEIPGADTGLAQAQIDQALRLLLAALSGIIASLLVAGVIARALGRPIDTLRRTAIAIGRHEAPPLAHAVPVEFTPVFGAIHQMEQDLRETEAELRSGRARTAAILSTVATGVIGVDANGNVMHVNPRAASLLDRQLVVGDSLDGQLPPAWRRAIGEMRAALRPAAHAPESREVEVDNHRFAVTLAALGDGGLVVAITDITEASRAARIVAWGEMARQVAHEIKNPLTPMRLGLQHLRRVQADHPPDYSRIVAETTERLLVEIDRLDRIARSFARYGSPPEQTAPLESIALRPAVEELAALFALTAESPRIEIQGDGGELVLSRREELVQVLLNLLDNARQAGASRVVLAMDGVVLRIVDDGRGITPDQLGRIFEPAFSTNTSGTGLGLAIVRRLVEGWEATITADSVPGAGATFAIRFAPGA